MSAPVWVRICLVFGLGLLVACGPEPRRTAETFSGPEEMLSPDEADPVVARVNGTLIRVSHVMHELTDQAGDVGAQDVGPGDEVFERALDELIDQRLLALEARARGLERDPEVHRRLAVARERILSNVLVETALNDAVTDEVIQRIYEEQINFMRFGDEVRARHILVRTREEAEAIEILLESGESFAELAVATSQDHATRLDGGDLGYFTRGGILPAFGAVAFSTRVGEVSPPFQTEYGWHLLQIEDRRRQPAPTLDQMRPQIVSNYTLEHLQTLVDTLRVEAEIQRPDLAGPDEEDDMSAGDAAGQPPQDVIDLSAQPDG